MNPGRKLKILHCPTMVGGNPQGLSAAEKAMGFDSTSLALSQTYFNYKTDRIVYRKGASTIENQIRRWIEICRMLATYNVIHFNFGETLAPSPVILPPGAKMSWRIWAYNNLYARWVQFIDLKLARILGKVVTVTYQGDDARQGDYCGAHYPIHFCREVEESYYSPASDTEKRRRIAIFGKYAHFIYAANPDLLNVLPSRAKFLPYASVDPRAWTPVHAHNDIPHIVHAPSHRGVKGTKYILDAFAKLKAEGLAFKYTLVENMSNEDARKVYETADILVDQLLAGYYGGLAVELMALGKPVICYMREQDLAHMPDLMRRDIPVINADPESIYGVLKLYLTAKKGDLPAIGAKSRAYAQKWHDPQQIARVVLDDVMSVLK